MDPYFDVTPSRLRVAFEGAGPEGERELSYEGFRAALETLGIRCSNNTVLLKLVKNIDRGKQGHSTLAQFDAAVHRLKLAHMLEEHTLNSLLLLNHLHLYPSRIISVQSYNLISYAPKRSLTLVTTYKMTQEKREFARPYKNTVLWLQIQDLCQLGEFSLGVVTVSGRDLGLGVGRRVYVMSADWK